LQQRLDDRSTIHANLANREDGYVIDLVEF
jgi:hypothetical protein